MPDLTPAMNKALRKLLRDDSGYAPRDWTRDAMVRRGLMTDDPSRCELTPLGRTVAERLIVEEATLGDR